MIAKRCLADAARVERTVYERVLSELPVTSLRLHGVSDEQREYTWLFLEDAGDVEWSSKIREHRRLATDWFAAVHVAARDLVHTVELPRRDAAYYLECLKSARLALHAGLANDLIDSDARGCLERFISDCDAIEASWDEVERLWDKFPRTLTLPGFCKKNVRIRTTATGAALLPFDFENAGWGVPAAELARVDIERYIRVAGSIRAHRRDVTALVTLGSALFSLKSVPGEEDALLSAWPHRSLSNVAYYATKVASAAALLRRRPGGRL